jgi:hypothetical protein
MLRAKDKLEEAAYFLDQLRQTNGQQPAFRFLASAAITAARSIGLVLQADLRSGYVGQFDAWWEERRKQVPVSRLGFDFVREARNIILKEGNRILRPVMRAEVPDGLYRAIEVVVDPVNPKFMSDIRVYMRGEDEELGTVYLPEGMSIEDVTPEVLSALVAPQMDALHDALGAAITRGLHFELTGYEILGDDEPLTFDEVVAELGIHLDAMREVVDEAEKRFPVKPRYPARR